MTSLNRAHFIGQAVARRRLALGVALAACLSACGSHAVPSPFAGDAGADAGAAGSPDQMEGGLAVGDDAGDPTLGGPCTDDGQCDDAVSCTTDRCDATLMRCRHTPDDSPCDDGVYCNGVEACDPRLGCGAGAPVSCSDSDSCTIDTCVETDHSCTHAPRDADGDGDPVWNCPGGGDCDDTDPSVSSKAREVCNNGKDDNCDGKIDEKPCLSPAHDTCADPLVLKVSGSSSLSLAATRLDYPTLCAPAGQQFRDVVVALSVPPGPAQDIDVVAQTSATMVSLGTADRCGDAASARCAESFVSEDGSVSRLHLYGVTPGNHTLYVAANAEGDVTLGVQFSAASAPPSNETCGTALALVPGVPQTAELASAQQDLSSQCASESGDLVYQFTLAEAADVRVFGDPLDPYGVPQLSLRDAACSTKSAELTCRLGTPASLFARALPAGQYFLSVGASGPTNVDLRLEESPASAAPADQGCENPPALTLGQTVDLTFTDHADAVQLGCIAGAPDSSHSLTLNEPSDVLLVERTSKGDVGAVELALPTCAEQTRLACGTSMTSPVRAHAYGVAKGSYRAVAESASGDPVSLTAFARAALPAKLVAFADDCGAPFEIPEIGGLFQGNTANANADYDAGCDVGNHPKGGAPDQMLHLKLSAKSRVVLDMSGSTYSTLLSVRGGATCPGTELELACAAGYRPDRSFLDLDLDSGDYYVQVDGYAGESGAWWLDVYVSPDAP